MSHTYSSILIHAVYSTKRREPVLTNRELRIRLHQYMGGVLKHNGAQPLGINGVEDHIHMVFGMPPSLDVARLIKETKRSTSIWLKSQDSGLAHFGWQRGYGAFSVSKGKLRNVRQYIADQEQHHRKITFDDEWKSLLRIYGLDQNQ
ncbi:MAG: IS200/IS605 family transposase [Puniceicoccaceae bacterium]